MALPTTDTPLPSVSGGDGPFDVLGEQKMFRLQRSGALQLELPGDQRVRAPQPGGSVAHGDPPQLQRLTDLLVDSVYRATEERKLTTTLNGQALTDELTGLLARRGFFALVEHQLKLTVRMPRPLFLAVVVLDGLRQIRDSLGHHEGDLALQETAKILRNTSRESDILARLGEDEFALLGIGDPQRTDEIIPARLREALHQRNTKPNRCHLSVSVGVAHWDSIGTWSIEILMANAKEALHEQKQGRH